MKEVKTGLVLEGGAMRGLYTAAFVCHTDCRKKWSCVCTFCNLWLENKPCLLVNFTYTCLCHLLAWLYKSCRKLIHICIDWITKLLYKHDFILFFSIYTINNYTIRCIFMSCCFKLRWILLSGCHIIFACFSISFFNIKIIEI